IFVPGNSPPVPPLKEDYLCNLLILLPGAIFIHFAMFNHGRLHLPRPFLSSNLPFFSPLFSFSLFISICRLVSVSHENFEPPFSLPMASGRSSCQNPSSGMLSHFPIQPTNMSERKPFHPTSRFKSGCIQSVGRPRPLKFSSPDARFILRSRS